MPTGVIALLVAVAAAVAIAVVYQRRNGRFRALGVDRGPDRSPGVAVAGAATTPRDPSGRPRTDAAAAAAPRTDAAAPAAPRTDAAAPAGPRLSADDLGAPLGERATLVQFSSAFCAPCRAARTLLDSVAGRRDGVTYVDVDAESHLDLVRALDVLRTPTVVVLDPDGAVVDRASGLPRRTDVEAVLDRATAPGP